MILKRCYHLTKNLHISPIDVDLMSVVEVRAYVDFWNEDIEEEKKNASKSSSIGGIMGARQPTRSS